MPLPISRRSTGLSQPRSRLPLHNNSFINYYICRSHVCDGGLPGESAAPGFGDSAVGVALDAEPSDECTEFYPDYSSVAQTDFPMDPMVQDFGSKFSICSWNVRSLAGAQFSKRQIKTKFSKGIKANMYVFHEVHRTPEDMLVAFKDFDRDFHVFVPMAVLATPVVSWPWFRGGLWPRVLLLIIDSLCWEGSPCFGSPAPWEKKASTLSISAIWSRCYIFGACNGSPAGG